MDTTPRLADPRAGGGSPGPCQGSRWALGSGLPEVHSFADTQGMKSLLVPLMAAMALSGCSAYSSPEGSPAAGGAAPSNVSSAPALPPEPVEPETLTVKGEVLTWGRADYKYLEILRTKDGGCRGNTDITLPWVAGPSGPNMDIRPGLELRLYDADGTLVGFTKATKGYFEADPDPWVRKKPKGNFLYGYCRLPFSMSDIPPGRLFTLTVGDRPDPVTLTADQLGQATIEIPPSRSSQVKWMRGN